MTATATVQRRRGRDDDRPRALRVYDRLGRKLHALYLTAASSRRGAEVGNASERPTPASSTLLDMRAFAEETLGRLEHLVTVVTTGGETVGSVSGWWGTITCPVCGQDTLLLDTGAAWVSCTNEDCDEGSGEPFSDHQKWLERRSLELGYDGKLTVNERQVRRIEQLEADVARWRDQAADWRALYERAVEVLGEHGLDADGEMLAPSSNIESE